MYAHLQVLTTVTISLVFGKWKKSPLIIQDLDNLFVGGYFSLEKVAYFRELKKLLHTFIYAFTHLLSKTFKMNCHRRVKSHS